MIQRFFIVVFVLFLSVFIQPLQSQQNLESVQEQREKEAILKELRTRYQFIIKGNPTLEQLREVKKKISQSVPKVQSRRQSKPKPKLKPKPKRPQRNIERERYLSQFMDKKTLKEKQEKERISELSERRKQNEKEALLEELHTRFGFVAQDDTMTLEQLKLVKRRLAQSPSKEQSNPTPTPTSPKQKTSLKNMTREELTASLAPYRALTREEARQNLQTKLQALPVATDFLTHPKIIEFIDELIRRPNALEKALSIVQGKHDLISYLIFLVITYFLGLFYKKVHMAKESVGIQKVLDFFSRIVLMNSLRIGIFVFFFKQYLDETFWVFVQVFF